MGYYTRVKFAAKLKADTPDDVVALLSAMAASEWERAKEVAPRHEFFDAERWTGLLCGTYAAPSWPEADGKLSLKRHAEGTWCLSFHSSTKNYDGELDKFLTWIAPHVAAELGDAVGEYEGEDSDRPTTLIAQVGRIDRVYEPVEEESGWWYGHT